MTDEKPDVEIDADRVEIVKPPATEDEPETDVADRRNDPDEENGGDAPRADEIDDPDVESADESEPDVEHNDVSKLARDLGHEPDDDDDDVIDDASDPEVDPKPAG